MENLIDSQHGPAILLASLVVILALHLIAKVGEFLFSIFRKKSEGVDQQIMKIDLSLTQNTQAMRELRIQVQQLERELSDVHKLNLDIQNLSKAIKLVAGKKWPGVKKALAEEVIPR